MKTNCSPDTIATDLLRRVIEEFTLNHEHIVVEAVPVGSKSYVINLQLDRADTPRVIGEKGMHMKALDLLAAAIGNRHGVTMRVRLIEPEVGQPGRYNKFKPAEDWNSSQILQLAADIAGAVFRYRTTVDLHDTAQAASTIEIMVEPGENKALVDGVKRGLEILFNAIGKANGRILFVEINSRDGVGAGRDLASIMG